MNYKELFEYDPASGTLTWRIRAMLNFRDKRHMNAWNARFAGTLAGKVERVKGEPRRIVVKIWDRKHGAHRVIWQMINGPIEEGLMIDHVDGDPTNNRLENLRLATNSQNQLNRRRKVNATHDLKGISFEQGRKKPWKAGLRIDGKTHFIGRYATKEEAHEAYCALSLKLFKEFARFN